MFQPIIYITVPEEVASPFVRILEDLCPKEIGASFGSSRQQLQLKPTIFCNQEVKNIDDICYAPHLLLYCFTCNDKNDFVKTIKPNYLEYCKNFKRDYLHIQPVYIKMSKKSKLFGTFSSTFLQQEITNIQIVEMKTNDTFKEETVSHIWQPLVQVIAQSIVSRITLLNNLVQKQLLSIETFRNSLRLCIMYDYISNHQKLVEVVDSTNELIDKHAGMFKFITPKSLSYRIDFCIGADALNRKVFNTEPTEYDLRFLLLKKKIQSLIYLEQTSKAIEEAFHFIVSLCERIKNDKSIDNYNYNIWLTQALSDLMVQCQKEIELEHPISVRVHSCILEWYLKILPNMRQLHLERSNASESSESDNLKHPSRSSSSDFALLEKILSTDERFQDEIRRILVTLKDVYKSEGLLINASVVEEKLSKYAKEEEKQALLAESLSSLARSKCTYFLNHTTEDTLKLLKVQDKIRVCCRILSDKNTKDYSIATKCLSDIFTSSQPEHCRTVTILPIQVSLVNDEETQNNNRFVQLEEVTLKVRFSCGFKGEIKTKKLVIGFMNWKVVRIVYFSVYDASIYDGAVISISHRFPLNGSYVLYNMKLVNAPEKVSDNQNEASERHDTTLNITIPSSKDIIHVDPVPKYFDFEIQVPDFLLPRRWQLALLKINVNVPRDSIQFKVTGPSFHLAPMRMINNNKDKIDPENGLTFNNVAKGTYELHLPIQPLVSGSLKIEAISGNKAIIHKEVDFTVSEFLEIKLQYRIATKVAQITTYVKSPSDLSITKIDFYGKDNEKIESQAIGLPINAVLTPTTGLFIIESEPDVADVWVKQKGLREFSLRLNVEKLEEESMTSKSRNPVQNPLTTIAPINFTF